MIWMIRSLFLALLVFSSPLLADDSIALIVGKSSSIQKLSNDQIKSLFLGQTRFVGEGKAVTIADRDRNSAIYKEFYALATGMSVKDVAVHWARKVFTGEAPPPTRIAGDDTAAKDWVRSNDEGLTYVYAKNCDANVRIVALIENVPAR
jgi:hypothetical protein